MASSSSLVGSCSPTQTKSWSSVALARRPARSWVSRSTSTRSPLRYSALSTITVEGYDAYAPAMATVILARHGRTAANATGVLAGRTKGVHLDDAGIAQSEAAAERLVGLD